MTAFDSSTMEIEFEDGVWTDVTEDCRMPVEIRDRGRKTPYDEIGPASMSFVLKNPTGDYTPGNTAGANWPNVVKGKRCRWTVTKGGTSYVRAMMRIQRWRPSWPSNGDYTKGVVQVQAVDDLALLGQRKMRSQFTEVCLWVGRSNSTTVDVYEASGKANGVTAFLTNYSEDASPGVCSAAYATTDPTLSFQDDTELSVGQVVRSSAGNQGLSCKTIPGFQASPKSIIFHLRGPEDLLDSTYWCVASFEDASNAALFHLILTRNGSTNGLFLMDSTMTVNLALTASAPFGQWMRVDVQQNGTNAARLDVTTWVSSGGLGVVTDINLDIRNVRYLEIPHKINQAATASWGGIVAFGSLVGVDVRDGWASGTGYTLASRVTSIGNMIERLPVTVGTVGSATSTALLVGTISGRTALDVLREVARSAGALVWARPRDSAIYVIASDLVRPTTPVATISVQDDCAGPPVLDDATDTQPTRIDVTWPGGAVTAVDAVAEAAGEQRSASISTVCTDASAAQTVGQELLAVRSAGIRISTVTVDLIGAVTDHTAALFSTAATLEGLYPSARVRFVLPTSSMLGNPTVDAHVEGWTEVYDDGRVTLQLDTSPAIAETLASETWTGANGAAWPAQWVAGYTGTSSTIDIQSNRGRIVVATEDFTSRRLDIGTVADIDATVLIRPGTGGEAGVFFRADSTGQVSGLQAGLDADTGQMILWSLTGGTYTQVDSAGSVTAGVDYYLRVRAQGAYVSCRFWAAAGSEPGTWGIEHVETTYTSAGYVGLYGFEAATDHRFDSLTLTTGA